MKTILANSIASFFCLISRQLKWTIPLSWVYKLRWLLGDEILGLPVLQNNINYQGKFIADKYLSRIFKNEIFNTWTLDIDTLNFLVQSVKKKQPQAILEFGSGISTICFAYLMKELYPASVVPRVFSIEQDQSCLESVHQRLAGLGLEKTVRLLLMPLKQQTIEGVTANCYYLLSQPLDTLIEGTKPDFILVDGPSGKRMTRFGTLPMIKNHVSDDACFYVDDSLRNDELNIARRWQELPYMVLDGVYMFGKGLLKGKFLSSGHHERKN